MQSFQIYIDEHRSVNGTLYSGLHSDRTVIIASATGVVQSFYQKLARFLQSQGISVITFDYAGIGKSLQGNIKSEHSNLANWGDRDLEAVIKYALDSSSHQKIVLLGHSVGGQLIGLAPSAHRADKIILVSAQSGYWKFWKGSSKIRMWINWHLLVPLLTTTFGYLPSKIFSRMESLPKNVALDWAKWCRSRSYLFAQLPSGRLYFNSIKGAITSIQIEDDFYAPKESVEWLTKKFNNAGIKKLHLVPEDFGVSKIGHFSLFTEKFRDSIWNILLEEVNNQ